MGHGSYSGESFKAYSKSKGFETKTAGQIYTSVKLAKDLDPKGVKFRESVDSKDNPNSTPVILGLDVTGSMEAQLTEIARHGLDTVARELHEKQIVTNPHIMCMGIGDLSYDTGPLQVSQFEADLRIIEQLEKLWFERGGGNNNNESYSLPWYFAAYHTKIDSWDKRQKKGYLFTIGDEEPNLALDADILTGVLGYEVKEDLSTKELLKEVSKRYEVFHLMVEEGSYFRNHADKCRAAWTNLMGQNAIPLKNHKKVAEVILTTIAVNEGKNMKDFSKGWKDAAALDAMSSVVGHFKYHKKLDI